MRAQFKSFSRLAAGLILTQVAVALGLGSALAAEHVGKFKSKVDLPSFELFSQGRYVYERNCVICHGERGDGRGQMGLTMDVRPRDFRAGLFKYRSTDGDSLPTTDDLLKTVRQGITGTAMPIFGHLPERELRAVVEYIKFFSPRWNDPKNYGKPFPTPVAPDWMDDGDKLKEQRKKGAELFTVSCVPCHGTTGQGDGPNAAQLLDHWERPIKPGNLRAERLRQGDESSDWYRVLTVGISGTPMPVFGESLTPEQRWQIVAYLQELRSKPVEPKK
jgi:mono/diheme cytochrome c family protein